MLQEDSFEKWTKPDRVRWLDYDTRAPGESTYLWADDVGPDPIPEWVITSGDATDEDIGLLKSGKEADVYVMERRLGDVVNLLAAKRFRDDHHRAFRNDGIYRVKRRTRDNTREDRALANKSVFGAQVRAVTWAMREMATLTRLWQADVPVPYPVQRVGTEVLLEYIGDGEAAAPRLVQVRATASELADLCEQAVAALRAITAADMVHGDLSPYNLLVDDGRLVVIDVPQAVDVREHPEFADLLHRDVTNLLGWFVKKGATVDAEAVYAELLDHALFGS